MSEQEKAGEHGVDTEDDEKDTWSDDSDVEEEGDESTDVEATCEALQEEIEELREERDELTARLKRTAADFENYKKRQQRERERIQAEASEQLIERLLDVRDNLKRAIDEKSEDVEALREGVKLTLDEFDRVLDAEGLGEIDPEPGASVDPSRHEVMLQVDSEQPPGHVAEVFQPGYVLGEKVLRPAQITVSEQPGETEDQ